MKDLYKEAGVDIDLAENALKNISKGIKSTYNMRVIPSGKGFAGLFSLNFPKKIFRKYYKDPILVSCTDGVGTKLLIAIKSGIHDTVGIDLVAMSVNDLIVTGAEPLFFLDYFGCGKLEKEVFEDVVSGIIKGCKLANVALLGGETAELPDMYPKGEYDLAGFAVGVVDRKKIIKPKRVVAGDILLGLASSGLHSNGFSLVRKILLKDKKIPLNRKMGDLGKTLGEELLTPTRIYVKSIKKLLGMYKRKQVVHGMAHITGGGFHENIPRILPDNLSANIKKKAYTIPPIFKLLKREGKLDEGTMYRVFNMGIGMVMAVSKYHAVAIKRELEKLGEIVCILGDVIEGNKNVKIK